MGKKDAEPDEEPEPVQLEPDFCVAEDAALEIIDIILEQGGNALYDIYVKQRQVPFATHAVMDRMFDVTRTGYLKRDAGSSESVPLWLAEEEPQSSTLDSWARGAVGIKNRASKPQEFDEYGGGLSRGGPYPPSESGYSRGSTAKRSGTGKRLTKASKDEGLIKTMDTPASPREVGLRKENSRLGGEQTAAELEFMRQIAEMERKEQEEFDRKARARQAEKDKADAHEKLLKELKGKDYTLDHNGEVVIINPIRSDKLPPAAYNMGISIINPPPPRRDEDASPRRRAPQASSTGGPRRGKSKKPKKDIKAALSEYFQVSTIAQPPILNDLRIGAGCSVTEGEENRRGPNRKEDPTHMSKKEFSSMYGGDDEDEDEEGAAEGEEGGEGGESSLEGPSTGAYTEKSAATAADSNWDAVDPLAGGRVSMTKDADGTYEDVNMQLINDPDWGQNIPSGQDPRLPPQPVKPDEYGKMLGAKVFGAADQRNPRDRPFITTSPKKKLPAPPYGFTTGHGVPTAMDEGSFVMGSQGPGPSVNGPQASLRSLNSSIGNDSMRLNGKAKQRPFRSGKQQRAGGRMEPTDKAQGLLNNN